MSSSALAIQARGLSKEYLLAHRRQGHGRRTLVDALRTGDFFRRNTYERLVALRDATFDVAPGEVIGIIGRNGAGKSTLLKILSRIVEPTGGEAIVRGRLGTLLEVGTGFHPELTGRENIFLNGAILGMRTVEVKARFEEIVDFSGVERFLDTPVKRYSSGMAVRLAFAVAAHLQADILVVDEVLAVGDAAFQQKCLDKMDAVGTEGRTVLLVSHNMSAVTALTKRALLVEQGRVTFDGPTNEAVQRYLGGANEAASLYLAEPKADRPTLTRVAVETSHAGQTQQHGGPLRIGVEIMTPMAIRGARLTIDILDRVGRLCAHAWHFDSDTPFARTPGAHELTCRFPRVHLAPGHYFLRVMLAEYVGGARLETLEGICPFEVVMLGQTRDGGWPTNEFAYIEDAVWSVAAAEAAPTVVGVSQRL